jgi:hypothetical protein
MVPLARYYTAAASPVSARGNGIALAKDWLIYRSGVDATRNRE